MAKEWTDDEVTEEIQRALAIFREDHIVKRLGNIESLLPKGNSSGTDNDPKTDGEPPPVKEPKESNTTKKKSLWWGEEK